MKRDHPSRSGSRTQRKLFEGFVSYTAKAKERETLPRAILYSTYLLKFTTRVSLWIARLENRVYISRPTTQPVALFPKLAQGKREEWKRACAINTHLLNRGIFNLNSREDLERGFLIALFYVLWRYLFCSS